MLDLESYQKLRFQGALLPRLRPAGRACGTASRSQPVAEWAEDDRQLAAEVFERAALDLAAYRPAPLIRRMPAVRRSIRRAQVSHALRDATGANAKSAIDSLLIGHTAPFRDQDTFDFLRTWLLHDAGGRPSLSVLSVGCSSGVELLSVALLLLEAGRLGGSYLCGLDCRDSAIRKARRASSRFWESVPQQWVALREAARTRRFLEGAKRIDWVVGDALRFESDRSWDIVLCRNLAIYLNPHAAHDLWRRLAAGVVPGGLLITGKAERPAFAGFHRLQKCVYRKEQCANP